MFCQKCGSENPDNAKFCGNCSQELVIESTDNSSQPVEINADPQPVSALMKYGVTTAAFLIPIIGLVMGIIYLNQGETEEKKDVGKLWLFACVFGFVFYLALSNQTWMP